MQNPTQVDYSSFEAAQRRAAKSTAQPAKIAAAPTRASSHCAMPAAAAVTRMVAAVTTTQDDQNAARLAPETVLRLLVDLDSLHLEGVALDAPVPLPSSFGALH